MRRIFLLALLATSCASYRDVGERFGGDTLAIYHGQVQRGDDPRWAAVNCNECEQWPRLLLPDLELTADPFWIRIRIVTDAADAQKTLGLYVSFLAATEVFWDGERIGTSGTIANGRAIRPGPIDNLYPLRAKPGRHLLAIRVAPIADASRVAYFGGIAIGDHAHMARSRVVAQVVPLSGMGVFVVIGIYFLVLARASERRAPLIVFSVLCFAASLLVIVETWRWIAGYTADWHLLRLQTISALTLMVALLLPLFFALELRLPRLRTWIAIAAALVILSFALQVTYDDRCFAAMRAAVIACAAMTLFSLRRPRWDLLPLALGIAILGGALIVGGYGFSDNSFFVAFAAFIVLLLVSLGIRADHDRRRRETAELRAARLEIELLKRSIQPHFLMNTIMAVMEWIEENPSEGVKFLESLADELRVLGEIAGERVVPLSRELALCRSHLTLMSCRTRTRFELVVDNVDPEDQMPPAIFHTLIENAITHNHYGEEDVAFHLAATDDGTTRRYEFDAPVRNATAAAQRDGVGLRYVKARLEEAYPGQWRVEAGLRETTWRTTIEVRR